MKIVLLLLINLKLITSMFDKFKQDIGQVHNKVKEILNPNQGLNYIQGKTGQQVINDGKKVVEVAKTNPTELATKGVEVVKGTGIDYLDDLLGKPKHVINHHMDMKNLLGGGLSLMSGIFANSSTRPNKFRKINFGIMKFKYQTLKNDVVGMMVDQGRVLQDITILIDHCGNELNEFEVQTKNEVNSITQFVVEANAKQRSSIKKYSSVLGLK